MHEHNETSLYDKIRGFAQQFTYIYEQGVTIEIEEFFSHQLADNIVQDFTLFFDEDTNHYKVIATLETWSIASIHDLFMSLFRFITYANASIFVRKQTKEGIHYEFASFTEAGRGFYCEIDFLPATSITEAESNQKDYGILHQIDGLTSDDALRQPDIQWRTRMDCADNFPLIAAHGMIYTVNLDEILYALDAENGTLRWQWEPPDQYDRGGRIASSPCIDQSVLCLVVHYNQRDQHKAFLYIIEAQTGLLLQHISIPPLQHCSTFNLLTVQDEIAYISGTERGSHNTHCLCLAVDLQTGRCKWTVDLGEHIGTTTPVVAHAHVYLVTLASQAGHLHALDAQTGETTWTYTFARQQAQEITVIGTDIFVAGVNLEVVDAMTGKQRGIFASPHRILNGPPVVNNELICISYEENLAATNKSGKSEILLAGGPPRRNGIMAVDQASMQLRWEVALPEGSSKAKDFVPVRANHSEVDRASDLWAQVLNT